MFHNMFLSFCYESKNKMVVSLVRSIHIFFSLSQVKELVVRVVFAPSRDLLVLKRPFEAWPESGRDRMDWIWLTCDLWDFRKDGHVPCFRNISDGGHYVMSSPYYVLIQINECLKQKSWKICYFLNGKGI